MDSDSDRNAISNIVLHRGDLLAVSGAADAVTLIDRHGDPYAVLDVERNLDGQFIVCGIRWVGRPPVPQPDPGTVPVANALAYADALAAAGTDPAEYAHYHGHPPAATGVAGYHIHGHGHSRADAARADDPRHGDDLAAHRGHHPGAAGVPGVTGASRGEGR
jgi:hypothetical protein